MKVKITWKLALSLLLGLVGYYIVFQAFYNQIAFGNVFPYDGFVDMFGGVAYNFTPTFLQSFFITAIVFRPTKKQSIWHKIVIDTILVILINITCNIAFLLIMKGRVDWGGSAFNAIFVFLGVETTFYVINFKNSMRETEAHKQLALQYRFDALKAQVNPHFLFNSLNILYSLIDIDKEKSREFVLSLSQMYRYIMGQQNRDMVPLRDEIDFLHHYVDILTKRYRDQLTVVIDGEDRIISQNVVPYTLQLLVENVTKHNVISTRHPMTVTIIVSDDSVNVSNPIQSKPSESPSHVGLRYLSELYQMHGKEFIVTNDGTTFTATIPFI